MLEVEVGDEVAGPGVRNLVRYHVSVRLVPGEQGRGRERQARVLHPAKGEGRRQDQNVVLPPNVGTTQVLKENQKFDFVQIPICTLRNCSLYKCFT